MRNTSIALSDHWVEFTKMQIETGRYGSTSEVLREGLRLLEQQQKYHDYVVAALIEGEESGPLEEFDFEAFIAEIKDDDRLAA